MLPPDCIVLDFEKELVWNKRWDNWTIFKADRQNTLKPIEKINLVRPYVITFQNFKYLGYYETWDSYYKQENEKTIDLGVWGKGYLSDHKRIYREFWGARYFTENCPVKYWLRSRNNSGVSLSEATRLYIRNNFKELTDIEVLAKVELTHRYLVSNIYYTLKRPDTFNIKENINIFLNQYELNGLDITVKKILDFYYSEYYKIYKHRDHQHIITACVDRNIEVLIESLLENWKTHLLNNPEAEKTNSDRFFL